MKSLVLACSFGAMLISGSAFAHDVQQTIDPSLIIRTGGDGLDGDAYAQGNDHTGGMWQSAEGASGSMAASRPAMIGTAPANRQWSHLNTRVRHHSGYSY